MVEIIFCPVDETDTFITGIGIYFYVKTHRAVYNASASKNQLGVSSGSSSKRYAGAGSSSSRHSSDGSTVRVSSGSRSEPRRSSSNE
jgi:hypothetical protein